MDYMDIDEVYNVPDTPDRLGANNISGRDCKQKEGDSSVSGHSQNAMLTNEEARNRLKWRSKLSIDNGHRRKPISCHGKNLSISNNSDSDSDFTISQGNSSPSQNAHLFRRTAMDKSSNYENKYSLQSRHPGKGKAVLMTQSSNCEQNTVVDLTDQRGPTQVFQNAVPNRTSEDHNDIEARQRSTSAYRFSPLHGLENPSAVARNAYKGKEKIDDSCKGGLGIDYRKGISGESQSTAGKIIPTSFQAISSPRVSGQKRLVRNGCISPHNIAKAKQLAENHNNGSTDTQNDEGTLAADSSSSLIRDLIAEDSSSHRVQSRTINHVSSSTKPHGKTMDFSGRHSIAHNEEANGTSNANEDSFRCLEVLGGWRSTRNRTKKMDLSVSGEVQPISRANNESLSVDQQNRDRVMRRDNGNGSGKWIADGYHGDHRTVSFQHQSAPVASQVATPPMLQSGRFSGCRTVSSALIKRQKQGSASTSHGESSMPTPADSGIVFLGSSKGQTNSRSATNQNAHDLNISNPVIQIDEFSPEIRYSSSSNVVSCSHDDSDARARQLEADEMLARELQEQLYNEELGVGDGEIDAHIALALQQEETSQPAFSNRSHPVFHPRGSVISNFYRQFQSRSSQNSSDRRGAPARGPTSARLTRLRSRLPSRSPRMSYGERSSVFPPDMDLDMRMHILEALEAFNDMGMDGSFLQVERDFNENDYEMLLALDENNHQHGGATPDQINGLPQSTVQGGNFDEACAICLETPNAGEIIRHLPCLHKFHKDCIDPWLGRKTSCPVCKSSIT